MLSDELLQALKLCDRSPKDESGWSRCAPKIGQYIARTVPDELLETCSLGDTLFIRLTEKAQTLLNYCA